MGEKKKKLSKIFRHLILLSSSTSLLLAGYNISGKLVVFSMPQFPLKYHPAKRATKRKSQKANHLLQFSTLRSPWKIMAWVLKIDRRRTNLKHSYSIITIPLRTLLTKTRVSVGVSEVEAGQVASWWRGLITILEQAIPTSESVLFVMGSSFKVEKSVGSLATPTILGTTACGGHAPPLVMNRSKPRKEKKSWK